jgi:hypothetical protein
LEDGAKASAELCERTVATIASDENFMMFQMVGDEKYMTIF